MTSQVAMHKDTGIVTESELAQRKRDIRGRSAGWSPDADRGFDLSETGDDKAELPTTKKFAITELVEKFIRKKGSQFCVVSHSGKNLGCSPTHGGAAKRLAEVEYFKHKKSLAEDLVVKSLDAGELSVTDDELAQFVAYQNYVYAKSLFAKHLPGKHNQDDHAGGRGTAEARTQGTQQTGVGSRLPSWAKYGAKVRNPIGDVGEIVAVTKNGVRVRYANMSEADMTPARFNTLFKEEKHLPGKHDQADHAGVKGAAGKVSHTPAQIREAAARQYAKDEAVSIAQARKKVTSGAHVPTTKVPKRQAPVDSARGETHGKFTDYKFWIPKDYATSESEVIKQVSGRANELLSDISWGNVVKEDGPNWRVEANGIAINKSIIAKADQACLKTIWSQAYKYYTGKWIAAAQQFVLKQDWERAALAMAKARDGYQEEKNPKEWGCLDAWRQFYQDKVEGGK